MAKKGYWVVCYKSVSNPAVVSEYAKLAATALEALGGRVIVGAKTKRDSGDSRLDSAYQPGEPAVGSTAHTRRTAQVGD
jgi:hypothetical protein